MGDEVLTFPQTTLLILLGASEWPRWPDLGDSKAFANSARKVKAYFLDSQKFHLPQENLLDLFDSEVSADTMDETISNFLTTRIAEMAATNQAATDVVVYYIGHAGLVEECSDYYLAIRRTRKSHPGVSGLRIDALARTITKEASHQRRLIILDCCYAANAFNVFQAQGEGEEEVALLQAWGVLKPHPDLPQYPRKGTALLCASSRTKPSLLGPEGTEFSQALLRVLDTGLAIGQQKMSLRLVTQLVRKSLDEVESKAPRPEVHSPDQSEGDVANVPFFPNPQAQTVQMYHVEGTKKASRFQEASELILQAPLPPQKAPPLPVATSLRLHRSPKVVVILLCLVLLLGGGSATWLILTQQKQQIQGLRLSTTSVQFGFDAAHTHWNPHERVINAANVSHLRELWSYTTTSDIASSPTVANGIVYVGSGDGKLYAFDAYCRSPCLPLWFFQTGNFVESSPAVANDMVYVGSDDGNTYAFDATCRHACQPLWSYNVLAGGENGGVISSSPTVANGMVFIGSDDGNIYAFNATCRSRCQPLWSYQIVGHWISSSPAVANGLVYIGTSDGTFYAFDATCSHACQPLWFYTTGGSISSSPTVANGVVYIGTSDGVDGTFYAFNATCRRRCQPLWSFQMGAQILFSSPFVWDGRVYIGCWDFKFYAFGLAG